MSLTLAFALVAVHKLEFSQIARKKFPGENYTTGKIWSGRSQVFVHQLYILRGNCTPNQKNSMFCALSQN